MPASLLRESFIVFAREVRSLARDRHTVLYSVGLPLFLYPSLVWVLIQGVAYVRGMEEREDSVVWVSDASPGRSLGTFLAGRKGIIVLSRDVPSDAEARRAVESGAANAVVAYALEPGFASGARVFFSVARDASVKAKGRIADALNDYRRDRLAQISREAGKEPEAFLDVLHVTEEDLATPGELANHVASLILPLMMTVMTALGALYPALDSTVGEKERGTLETTLVSPARRISIVVGKYLAVSSFAFAAFVLNFASMGFTLLHLGSQLKLDKLSFEPRSVLVILGAACLLALFLSAVMMLIGYVARTFKEGQTYVMPVYLLAVVPAVLTSAPDVSLTPGFACIPIVNISLLFREALKDNYPVAGITLAVATSAAYAALALLCAARLLRQEAYATGEGLRLGQALSSIWKAR